MCKDPLLIVSVKFVLSNGPSGCWYVFIYRFKNVFLRCPTLRLHCFLSFHCPSFRFISFIAFFIHSIQFFFGLPRAVFCFGIHSLDHLVTDLKYKIRNTVLYSMCSPKSGNTTKYKRDNTGLNRILVQ